MEDLMCNVCLNDFDEKCQPKILECGHNLCCKCLKKILSSESNISCTICRATIPKGQSFPTNFALLSLSSQCKKLLTNENEVKAAIAELKDNVTKAIQELKDEMECSLKRMSCLETSLKRIIELESYEEMNMSVSRALHEITELKKNFESQNDQSETRKILNINDFENDEKYLYEVYGKGKVGFVFAILKLEDQDKFAEVKFLGDKVFVYSLSSSRPEPKRNVTYVWFQDLRKCWMELKFGTFLFIRCNEKGLEVLAEIELREGHMVNQFVKLCTGEIGLSYKGATYVKGKSAVGDAAIPILSIPPCLPDDILKDELTTYMAPIISNACQSNEYVVYARDDLCFFIWKMNNTKEFTNAIGRVVSPCHLTDIISYDSPPSMKIADCGVIFQLK